MDSVDNNIGGRNWDTWAYIESKDKFVLIKFKDLHIKHISLWLFSQAESFNMNGDSRLEPSVEKVKMVYFFSFKIVQNNSFSNNIVFNLIKSLKK
jgi:hypothetical protein